VGRAVLVFSNKQLRWGEQSADFPVVACGGSEGPPIVNPKLVPSCEEAGNCGDPCALSPWRLAKNVF